VVIPGGAGDYEQLWRRATDDPVYRMIIWVYEKQDG